MTISTNRILNEISSNSIVNGLYIPIVTKKRKGREKYKNENLSIEKPLPGQAKYEPQSLFNDNDSGNILATGRVEETPLQLLHLLEECNTCATIKCWVDVMLLGSVHLRLSCQKQAIRNQNPSWMFLLTFFNSRRFFLLASTFIHFPTLTLTGHEVIGHLVLEL